MGTGVWGWNLEVPQQGPGADPCGGLGQSFQKSDMHIQSAVDKRIFQGLFRAYIFSCTFYIVFNFYCILSTIRLCGRKCANKYLYLYLYPHTPTPPNNCLNLCKSHNPPWPR